MTASNYFVPGNKTILNIGSEGRFTALLTDIHGYSVGLVVRIVIPKQLGKQQLNNMLAKIYFVTPTLIIIQVDSRNFDPFILNVGPRSSWKFIAQVIPVGDGGTGFEDASLNNNNIIPEIYTPAPYPPNP
jgi:hypothetical protein